MLIALFLEHGTIIILLLSLIEYASSELMEINGGSAERSLST